MNIKTTDFIGSFNTLATLPEGKYKELAFIGRSNVGKSSLINLICNKKGLAKVSNTPGKTQSLNFFLINKAWYLVDLPGYGFAKRSKTLRKDWEVMMHQYFLERTSLFCLFQLIDSRIPPQELDLEQVRWLGENGIPFCLVFTKYEKKERALCQKNIQLFKNILAKEWEELPTSFITSSIEKTGKDDLLQYIHTILQSENATI